jgi:acyl carrier protein
MFLCGVAAVLCVATTGCDARPTAEALGQRTRASVSTQSIESRVRTIVGKLLDRDPSKLKLADRFIADLGADELDTVELVMEFEETFTLNISDKAAENMVTIGDVVKYMEDELEKKKVEPLTPPDRAQPAASRPSAPGS